ncbi:MAG: hypothetical protein WD034_09110 [Parvibaculum sp.]|jgi:predicted RND superfamily exporter protein|uniref:hypothetical protein n=1 Tax=Parvibaculum sp. TaxID=2024848 RepID=UPI0034A0882F
MKKQRAIFLASLLSVAGFAGPAAAYVGPGAGLSVIGALVGVLLAVGAAAVFVVGWPIRRMMRRRKEDAAARAAARNAARSSPAS